MALYSIAEQHLDGFWWCHQSLVGFDSKERAEEAFKACFWWDLERPHKVLEHQEPFPETYSWYSEDFEHWYENYTDKPLRLKCAVIEVN